MHQKFTLLIFSLFFTVSISGQNAYNPFYPFELPSWEDSHPLNDANELPSELEEDWFVSVSKIGDSSVFFFGESQEGCYVSGVPGANYELFHFVTLHPTWTREYTVYVSVNYAYNAFDPEQHIIVAVKDYEIPDGVGYDVFDLNGLHVQPPTWTADALWNYTIPAPPAPSQLSIIMQGGTIAEWQPAESVTFSNAMGDTVEMNGHDYYYVIPKEEWLWHGNDSQTQIGETLTPWYWWEGLDGNTEFDEETGFSTAENPDQYLDLYDMICYAYSQLPSIEPGFGGGGGGEIPFN